MDPRTQREQCFSIPCLSLKFKSDLLRNRLNIKLGVMSVRVPLFEFELELEFELVHPPGV